MTPTSIRLEVASSRRLPPLAAANEVQRLRIRQHAATGMICSEIGQIPRRREVPFNFQRRVVAHGRPPLNKQE